MLSVYFAGRLEDRRLVAGVRDRLVRFGIRSTARWLRELIARDDVAALACLADIAGADAFLLVNPEIVHGTGTGGRHVELGVALALGKPIVVLGGRENAFHHLRGVRLVPWESSMGAIAAALRLAPRGERPLVRRRL
jgi:hypothetical protein